MTVITEELRSIQDYTGTRYELLGEMLRELGYSLTDNDVIRIGAELMEFFEALCGDDDHE
jgi:hypothetical protein